MSRTTRCISSTSSALRSVFLVPIEGPKPSPLLYVQKWQAIRPRPVVQWTSQRNVLLFTPKEAPTKSRLPRDEEILDKYREILLVENGVLPENPIRTTHALSRLDPKVESLTVVSEPTEDQPYPICKVINKVEEYKRHKEQKKSKVRDYSKTTKTIELNWAIEKGDIQYRLGQMRKFLERGYKVEIVMVMVRRKGRARPPIPMETMQELVDAFKGAIVEGGWKESKPMEGNVGAHLTIFAQGVKPEKTSKKKKKKAEGEEGAVVVEGGGEGKEEDVKGKEENEEDEDEDDEEDDKDDKEKDERKDRGEEEKRR